VGLYREREEERKRERKRGVGFHTYFTVLMIFLTCPILVGLILLDILESCPLHRVCTIWPTCAAGDGISFAFDVRK
jgi:hypothetical protein